MTSEVVVGCNCNAQGDSKSRWNNNDDRWRRSVMLQLSNVLQIQCRNSKGGPLFFFILNILSFINNTTEQPIIQLRYETFLWFCLNLMISTFLRNCKYSSSKHVTINNMKLKTMTYLMNKNFLSSIKRCNL